MLRNALPGNEGRGYFSTTNGAITEDVVLQYLKNNIADPTGVKVGRDFAAWLGLVPKQYSSGGKERLWRMTKAGQADIRRLLIIGAMSRLGWLGQRTIVEGNWLSRMLARKPKMLVAIALANKMAQQI